MIFLNIRRISIIKMTSTLMCYDRISAYYQIPNDILQGNVTTFIWIYGITKYPVKTILRKKKSGCNRLSASDDEIVIVNTTCSIRIHTHQCNSPESNSHTYIWLIYDQKKILKLLNILKKTQAKCHDTTDFHECIWGKYGFCGKGNKSKK